MYTVGITGGIGSGKSVICNIFKILGIPVFNADIEAKQLLENKIVQDFYKSEFGEQLFTNDALDKAKIAKLIFSDKTALTKVNSFIHPIVEELFTKWRTQQVHAPYAIEEAALLFENKSYLKMNSTILVVAPQQLRIQRVMQRDGLNEQQILQRIKNQLPDEVKQKLTTFAIENNDTTLVIPQVLKIHELILNRK